MSAEQSKAFVRRYFDAMNRDPSTATIDEYVADEALKQHIMAFGAAFPGYRIDVEDMIAEGDKVVVRGVMYGTHKGDLMGIPPTGKEVTMPVIIIYRVAGGKIVEHWMQSDQLGLMQQLGIVPAL